MADNNKKLLANKIIYQIYPKSFLDTTGSGIGDINGIRAKLDYLADLGVDYIWLSPINRSPQNDNGYDIADYDHIDPMFGSDEDYLGLIKEAKQRNIKIMMDLVLNHTSDDHEWFKKAKLGDPKYKNYYIFRDQPNALQSAFSKSAWTYCEEVGQYYLHFFDSHQPDLNWQNPEARNELYAMVNRWIAKGVEGFRLDVIDLIGKEPDRLIGARGPKFYDFLKELNHLTFKDKILTVGECWGATFDDAKKMIGDDGLTQVFHFQHLTTTSENKDKWQQQPLKLINLANVLMAWQNEFDGIEAIVMNNHDLPRLLSLWLDDATYRVQSAKILIMLFGLLKGNLYIYQGEEIGMTNAYLASIDQYNDVETLNKYEVLKKTGLPEKEMMAIIAKISRDNARTPMQWSDEPHAGFTTGTPWLELNSNYREINVAKDLTSNDSIFQQYKTIIQFRKNQGDLLQQPLGLKVDPQSNVLILKKEHLLGYYHFGGDTVTINDEGQSRMNVLFHNYQEYQDATTLRPYEAVVYTTNNQM